MADITKIKATQHGVAASFMDSTRAFCLSTSDYAAQKNGQYYPNRIYSETVASGIYNSIDDLAADVKEGRFDNIYIGSEIQLNMNYYRETSALLQSFVAPGIGTSTALTLCVAGINWFSDLEGLSESSKGYNHLVLVPKYLCGSAGQLAFASSDTNAQDNSLLVTNLTSLGLQLNRMLNFHLIPTKWYYSTTLDSSRPNQKDSMQGSSITDAGWYSVSSYARPLGVGDILSGTPNSASRFTNQIYRGALPLFNLAPAHAIGAFTADEVATKASDITKVPEYEEQTITEFARKQNITIKPRGCAGRHNKETAGYFRFLCLFG